MRPPKLTTPAVTETPARERTTVVARAWAVVVPLILVNLLAAVGQVLWAREHLVDGLPARIAAGLPFLFAGAVESIALFLAYQAHQSRLAGDSAGYLSVAAYAWAGVAAWLQWSHWSPTSATAGVVYAAMSALSPWLWGIWSRSIHRAQLRAAGLVEERSVRFGRARWLLYPRRTFIVFREAVWAGEADPIEAIEAHDPGPRAPRPERTTRIKRATKATPDQPARHPEAAAPALSPDPAESTTVPSGGSSAGPGSKPDPISPIGSIKPDPVGGEAAGSTPTRSGQAATGAALIGSGGINAKQADRPDPAGGESGAKLAGARSVPADWKRVVGADEALVAAMHYAVGEGWISRPVDAADVRAVCKVGRPRDGEIRDQANAFMEQVDRERETEAASATGDDELTGVSHG